MRSVAVKLFGFSNFITGAGEANKNDGANILAVYNLNSPDQVKNIEIIAPYEKNIFGKVSPKTVNTITDPRFINQYNHNYSSAKTM